jgi:hypothetical protein
LLTQASLGPEALAGACQPGGGLCTAAGAILAAGAPPHVAMATVLPLLLAHVADVIARDKGRAAELASAAGLGFAGDSAGGPHKEAAAASSATGGEGRHRVVVEKLMARGAAAARAKAGSGRRWAAVALSAALAAAGAAGVLAGALLALVGEEGGGEPMLTVQGAW